METRVFKSGNSLAVRLPKGMELPKGKVSIRKEGKALVIEEISEGWSDEFFNDVRIDRKGFGREKPTYTEKKL
jgi:antitoxin VapB